MVFFSPLKMKFEYFFLFVLVKACDAIEVVCYFESMTYWGYTCVIENQTVADNSIVKFNIDAIETGKTYDDVNCVEFFNSEIDFLPEEIFSTFNAISRIILMNNGFKLWRKGYLKGGTNLIAFVIADNLLKVLEDDSFESSPNLQILALYDNKINDIEADAFKGLRDLRILQLNQNELEYLNENLFHDLESLTTLDLYDNKISLLPLNIFSYNKMLDTVRLDGNKLAAIAKGVFDQDSNIVSLNLTNNLLFTINAAVLPLGLEVIYVGRLIFLRIISQYFMRPNFFFIDFEVKVINAPESLKIVRPSIISED